MYRRNRKRGHRRIMLARIPAHVIGLLPSGSNPEIVPPLLSPRLFYRRLRFFFAGGGSLMNCMFTAARSFANQAISRPVNFSAR